MLRALSLLEPQLQRQAVLAQTQVRSFRSHLKRMRKPRWMPRAPSKLFELPKHPEISAEEYKQYCDLVRRYNVEVKSIQMYFRDEQTRIEAEKGKFSERTIHEEEEFERQLKAVEEENQRIAERRKAQHEEAFQARMAGLLGRAKIIDEKEQRKIEEARAIFKSEAEKFHHITLETLDDAIAKALDTQSHYDFAISATGEIIREKERTLGQ